MGDITPEEKRVRQAEINRLLGLGRLQEARRLANPRWDTQKKGETFSTLRFLMEQKKAFDEGWDEE